MQYSSENSSSPKIRYVFFSGGSALNSLATSLKRTNPFVTYILPISDDGGSSGEIRRILGGLIRIYIDVDHKVLKNNFRSINWRFKIKMCKIV